MWIQTAVAAPTSEGASSFAVSREKWTNEIEATALEEVCRPQSYYRECFDVTAVDCQKLIRNQVRACVAKKRIPTSVDSFDGGSFYASHVGICLVEQIGREWRSKFLYKQKCVQRGLWRE